MAVNQCLALQDQTLFIQRSYIDGQWVPSKSNTTFDIRDPASDKVIGTCPECTVADLDDAIKAAAKAANGWRSLSGRQRARILRKWNDLILDNKQDLATIITAENGKCKTDAEGEVVFSASYFEWFGEEAARIYGDVVPHSAATSRVQVIKEPVGVCGLITPWNFPLGMAARKVSAALAAGCTVVIKSDGVTPFATNALALLGERAGVPRGVVNIVTALGNTPQLGLAMCKSQIVKKISFTGSTRVGKLLMQQSSDTLKKLSLELGGNAPFIVFDDADLEVAVSSALASKFKVTGQTCVCANRFYVQDGIYDKFSNRLAEEVRKFTVGVGSDAKTTHGPLVGSNGFLKVQQHVEDAVKKNAKVIVGGKPLPSLGKHFFEPTVLTGVDSTMLVAQEETFGPVAALIKFTTEEEVIRNANDTEHGLAAYLMTQDLGKAYRISELLEAGMVAINTGAVSDAPVPFGGVKQSGFGREGSKYGLEDYMTTKSIITGGINVERARL